MDLPIKAVHSFHECLVTLPGKDPRKICPGKLSLALRFQIVTQTILRSVLYLTGFSGDLFPEVSIPLNRKFSVTQFVGSLLQSALEFDSRQRVIGAVICGSNRYDNGTVCIFSVTAAVAHTVDRKPPGFRGCIDHIASGTHAEGVNTSATACLRRYFIGSSPQLLHMFCAILASIDQVLWMLHTESNCKRFRRHGEIFLI